MAHAMNKLPIFEKEILISPSEWHNWLKHPVTQEFLSTIKRERDDWMEQQSLGDILLTQPEATALWYSKSVGIIYGLDYALAGVGEALLVQWEAARKAKEAEEREKGERDE